MYSSNKKVCNISLHRIVSKDQQGHDYTIEPAQRQSTSFDIEKTKDESLVFKVVWQERANYYEMVFTMANLKNFSVATDRKTLSIDFSAPPTCYMGSHKKPCDMFHQLDVIRMTTLLLFCNTGLDVELVRLISDLITQRKERISRPQRKRPRSTACDECDCCEYYREYCEEELRKSNKARLDAEQRRDQLEKELEHVNNTGMTADFDRDFYTPVVYNGDRLQKEVSEIKRVLTYEQWMVPVRPMGTFDSEVLLRANIDEEQATYLLHETLLDPNFNSDNKPLMEKIRRKYGEEVLCDALRCRAEIDQYNASAGHPVLVPWNFNEGRALTPSEMVKAVVVKTKQLSDENEELRQSVKRLQISPPSANTARALVVEERDYAEEGLNTAQQGAAQLGTAQQVERRWGDCAVM